MILDMSARDFNASYSNCVGIIESPTYKEGAPHFFKYMGWDDERTDVLIGKTCPVAGVSTSWCRSIANFPLNEVDSLEFPWPDLGLRDHGDGVVRVSRIPARQWRRGFTSAVLSFTALNEHELSLGDRSPFLQASLNSPAVIRSLFYPTYLSVFQGIAELLSGRRLGVALSQDLYLRTQWFSNDIYLGYKTTDIGVVNTDADIHTVSLFRANTFLQEQVSPFLSIRDYIL